MAFSIQEEPIKAGTFWQISIFIAFGVAFPVLISVVFAIVTGQVPSTSTTLDWIGSLFSFLILPVIGLILQAIFGFGRMIATGQVFFYLYFIIPGALSLIGVTTAVADWLYPAIQLLLLVAAFYFVVGMRRSLVHLIKWRTLLMILAIAAVLYGLTYALNVAGTAAARGISDNQRALEERPFWQLFFTGVIAAPVVEEYLIRRPIFMTFNKTLLGTLTGAFLSCFFFAYLHIAATNDWESFVTYFLPSLSLTLGLALFRNAMPSALAHLLNNLTALLAG